MTELWSELKDAMAEGWTMVMLPLAHHCLPDDGRCDRCDAPRDAGYLRLEGGRYRKYLALEIGRYCHDCMLVERGWVDG